MKIIKNILYVLTLLFFFIGCNSQDYESPGEEVSDLYILTSAGVNTTNMRAEVNKFFSFLDISQGTLDRKWTIPEGAFFLQGPIPNNLPNHDEYIINAGDTVSTDQTVHVMFKKGDSLTEVKYYGVFKDSTEFEFYIDYADGLPVPDTIRTERMDGKWVAEYTYLIDVYDTVVAKPELRYLDETILDHLNTATMTVQYGDKIILEDLSALSLDNNARPEATKWRLHTLEENEEDRTYSNTINFDREGDFTQRVVDTLTFTKLGEYQLELQSTRTRDDDLGASSDTYDIPTIFTVVSLAEDLMLIDGEDIVETDDNRIMIPISSRLAAIDEDLSADFTVKVDGTVIPVESVSITNASLNGNPIGRIVLSLTTDLVPADASKTVTVSYTGTTLMSLDERVLQTFTDEPIEVYVPSPVQQKQNVTKDFDTDELLVLFSQNMSEDSIDQVADISKGFTVTVTSKLGAGVDIPVNITSISVDSNNSKILRFKLDVELYRDDLITISSDGTSDLTSAGGGLIDAFGAVTVDYDDNNILGDIGMYETDFGVDWIRLSTIADANAETVTPSLSSATGKAMHLQVFNNNNAMIESVNEYSLTSNTEYRIKFKKYITDDAAITSTKTGNSLVRIQSGGSKENFAFNRDITDPSNLNTWFDEEVVFNTGTNAIYNNFKIRQLAAWDNWSDIYLDNLVIQLVDERP
ncbi:hypothetical protein MPF19_10990 [Polaribacter sp. Z014]|uniref:hypothetical protein n=1 Tax=unclassified Polaribacter TaxID=196858 RepID=UPI00193B1DEC|nr:MULTISPECIES: hypothetical protein [unclassified Polaribacter]MCL7763944.1 hypothetical protein [Polaribacter sp. Z014]QVY66044.1 hypothetical protein JOP69_01755 [Polaribacter sp. Q13]